MRKFAVLLAIACGGSGSETSLRMDFSSAEFWAAPFPGEGRDPNEFPNTPRAPIVDTLTELASEADGFGLTSTIFFTATAPLAPLALTPAQTVEWTAPVLLVPLEGERSPHPIEVRFREDGGPYGAANLLSILPLQGRPLRADCLYAAAIREPVLDAAGEPIAVANAVRELQRGRLPEGMSEAVSQDYQRALTALEAEGIDDVAALTVFRTGNPAGEMERLHEAVLGEPLPAPLTPWTLLETHSEFCVFETAVEMPTYQRGEPPFSSEGGEIRFVDGAPERVGSERARLFATIPRVPMPEEGYPLVVFSRTGGGGDRPLIDRGVRDASGEAIETGSGPARDFAQAGWAAIQIDGPHGGIRNVSGADEQLLIFNIGNPRALKDNIRQSALELALSAHIAETLRIDATECAGSGTAEAFFDLSELTLMGHSMGATISPLTFAVEPRFRALLLSGAGGSWIENVVHKELPVRVRPIAEVTLRVAGRYELHEHDPALMLLQWTGEAADPPVYRDRVRGEPRHILMMQGLVDRYILPPIANATSLAFDLDLAGTAYDEETEEVARFVPLREELQFSNGAAISLPASGNQEGVTAVVTQHPEDGVEDGHEVVFQRTEPKAQYRCFLRTLARGEPPTVPAIGESCGE